MLPFHLMIKPAGPKCNLDCKYCYYTGKSEYYPQSACRMDYDTLERLTEAYLANSPTGEVVFGWQGGEPLLMGVDFFRKAVELQLRYRKPGQFVSNAMQTNATLIDDEWAEFFSENNFLLGVSIDGPADLHNTYRVDRLGKNTHSKVVRAIELLRRHGVEHNALVTVNRANARRPQKVYSFLKSLGLEHLQFIPIVETTGFGGSEVTEWSVRPDHFGEFLCTIFDEWCSIDIGRMFIQFFESALGVIMMGRPSVCVFQKTCGRALVVEHNGDLYACDHFVYPSHLRGRVESVESLAAMVDGQEQHAFGIAKADLSSQCMECRWLAYCGGDCPKHRVTFAGDGKPISYLCPSYKRFFGHAEPALQGIAAYIRKSGSR
jgi:uncharacterized protein